MKLNRRWLLVITVLAVVSTIAVYKFSLKRIVIGEGLAGVRYSDSRGFYEKALMPGKHTISIKDTILIYDIKPFLLEDFIESRFKDGSTQRVNFYLKLQIKTEKLSELHSNYGQLFMGRFVEPTTYSSIRKCTEKVYPSDLIHIELKSAIDSSELVDYFKILVSDFSRQD